MLFEMTVYGNTNVFSFLCEFVQNAVSISKTCLPYMFVWLQQMQEMCFEMEDVIVSPNWSLNIELSTFTYF